MTEHDAWPPGSRWRRRRPGSSRRRPGRRGRGRRSRGRHAPMTGSRRERGAAHSTYRSTCRLDWPHPDGRTTPLRLARCRPPIPPAGSAACCTSPAGPGSGGIEDVKRAAGGLTGLRERFDLVAYDPRDTGLAATLPESCAQPAVPALTEPRNRAEYDCSDASPARHRPPSRRLTGLPGRGPRTVVAEAAGLFTPYPRSPVYLFTRKPGTPGARRRGARRAGRGPA